MAETGHARNVEHFQQMISFCTGYGADYAPTNAMIALAALNTALTDAQTSLDDVQAAVAPWKLKVADRENIYKGIRPLTTRIVNSYEASGTDANKVDNVKTLHRQIHGARAKALPKDDPGTPEDESKGNSVSHRSYVQVAEAFGQMIKQLDEDPAYAPNENDLKVATLTTLHTAMENANSAVITAATPMSNARIDRNEKLYGDTTGICDRAALVKKYVKSLYGADSPQYKQVSGLEFRPVK
jgi:hypothetical protein